MQDEEAIQLAVAQGFRTVCICRGVRQRTIQVAISKGATTLPEIRRKTMAMTGACGAKRCSGPIQGILRDALEAAREKAAIEALAQSDAVPSPEAAATPAPRAEPEATKARGDSPETPRRKRRRRRRGPRPAKG